MKQKNVTQKLAIAGLFAALAVAGSFISFPIFGSKCSPIQHMVNIMASVVLGPGWSIGCAFCASLLRNILGLGTLLAFPGSMAGALCCGLAFLATKKLPVACMAETFGTGMLGGLAAYPVAKLAMNLNPAGVTVYMLPFFLSTACGSIIAFVLLAVLKQSGVLAYMASGGK